MNKQSPNIYELADHIAKHAFLKNLNLNKINSHLYVVCRHPGSIGAFHRQSLSPVYNGNQHGYQIDEEL